MRPLSCSFYQHFEGGGIIAANRTQDKDTSIKVKDQPLDIGTNSGETDDFINKLQTMDTGNVTTEEDELRQGRADDSTDADSRGGDR